MNEDVSSGRRNVHGQIPTSRPTNTPHTCVTRGVATPTPHRGRRRLCSGRLSIYGEITTQKRTHRGGAYKKEVEATGETTNSKKLSAPNIPRRYG